MNVDGTVAAYRYPYLMLGDSLVLKQESPYYEHFYVALKPWKHYVPIKRNLGDLLEKVKWAKVGSMQLLCSWTITKLLIWETEFH